MENINKEITEKLKSSLRNKELFAFYSLYSSDLTSLHCNILRDIFHLPFVKITTEIQSTILLHLGWYSEIQNSATQNFPK